MKTDELLNLEGDFTWDYGCRFFIETASGNFIWSDPDYNGDNSIISYLGSYKDFIKESKIPYGRDKGRHVIRAYCGDEITFKE